MRLADSASERFQVTGFIVVTARHATVELRVLVLALESNRCADFAVDEAPLSFSYH